MYPLNTDKPWPRNQWYVAAFASELKEQPLGRTYLNEHVVLFRGKDGVAHALSGVCPHRMMPLEYGKVAGDTLICGYHGLTFDAEGACVAAPTSSTLPNCFLTRYPLREVGPLLWIWMGDPALAETRHLPDQASIGIGCEGWVTQCSDYALLEARYPLLIDNLFDLSHIGFIHASTIGEGGVALVEPHIEERDGRLVVRRTTYDVPPDDWRVRFMFPEAEGPVTSDTNSELLGISLISAGGPNYQNADRSGPLLGHIYFIHALTPETESSTHYWIMMTRDFRQDDEELSAALVAQNVAVVAQDRVALRNIEQLLRSGIQLPREMSMKPDQGALLARRRVIEMIRAEGD